MKVLFIKLGAIGDALMARSLPLAAHRAWPDAHVTWMAGRAIAPLVRRFRGVDRVVEVDAAALFSGSLGARVRAVVSARRTLGFGRYDWVVIGHGDPRYRVLGLCVRAGGRRHCGPGWAKSGRYHGHEYARLLLGEEPGRGAVHDRLDPPALPEELESPLREGGPGLLLFPGGARNLLRDDPLRRWPLERYARLAGLARGRGWRVWLGGAASDAWTRDAFRGQPHLDLIGRFGLVETLALCARAAAVVTHDSGPLHLAQAVGARVAALFGPTSPAEKVDPSAPGTTVFWGGAGLACRPCYDGRGFASCGDNVCLGSVAPEAVWEALESAQEPG